MGFSLSRTLGIRGDAGRFLNGGNTVGRFIDSGGLLNPANSGIGVLMGMEGGAFGSYGGKGPSGSGGDSVNSAGIMQPAYQSQLDSPTYRAMQGQFASGSASPWSKIAISRQNDLAETQKQELADRNAGQTAGSLDKLAAVGGLTSGARERTIQGGQKNYMTGVQDVGNALNKNLMNIGIEDAQNNQNIGKGLMTAEMSDLSGRNQYNQNKYMTDMQAWAAKQQANATRDAGGGGKK